MAMYVKKLLSIIAMLGIYTGVMKAPQAPQNGSSHAAKPMASIAAQRPLSEGVVSTSESPLMRKNGMKRPASLGNELQPSLTLEKVESSNQSSKPTPPPKDTKPTLVRSSVSTPDLTKADSSLVVPDKRSSTGSLPASITIKKTKNLKSNPVTTAVSGIFNNLMGRVQKKIPTKISKVSMEIIPQDKLSGSWLQDIKIPDKNVDIAKMPNATLNDVKALVVKVITEAKSQNDVVVALSKIDAFIDHSKSSGSSDSKSIEQAMIARYEVSRQEASLKNGQGTIKPLSDYFFNPEQKNISKDQILELSTFISRDVSLGATPPLIADMLTARLQAVKEKYPEIQPIVEQAVTITGSKNLSKHIKDNVIDKLQGAKISGNSSRIEAVTHELEYAFDYAGRVIKTKESVEPVSFMLSLEKANRVAPEITGKFLQTNKGEIQSLLNQAIEKQTAEIAQLKPKAEKNSATANDIQNHQKALDGKAILESFATTFKVGPTVLPKPTPESKAAYQAKVGASQSSVMPSTNTSSFTQALRDKAVNLKSVSLSSTTPPSNSGSTKSTSTVSSANKPVIAPKPSSKQIQNKLNLAVSGSSQV